MEFIAETAQEQLRQWDANETIWTVEMGGMGPGYEQAIQTAAIELIRDNLDKPLPEDGDKEAWRSWGDSTLNRIDDQLGGLTGAMWGAARNLAARILKFGPKKVLEDLPKDRMIQASKNWPRV